MRIPHGLFRSLPTTLAWLALVLASAVALAGSGGQLRIEVIDHETKQPLACRMHLTNAAGKSLKVPRVPYWHDHFVFDGNVTLKLPKGQYNFVIERGPEYKVRTGHFVMEDLGDDKKVVDLTRFADMAAEGWWSGDLDVARPAKDLELVMRADDLHVVELISWPNRKKLLAGQQSAADPVVRFDENRFYHLSAGIDARGGGTLLFYNLDKPLDLGGARTDYPPGESFIAAARKSPQSWIDAREAYGWDVPTWVAGGQIDSIQLQNSNLRRASVLDDEKRGKPRSQLLFPGTSGNGPWGEQIYYHLLNCGLRIPPTAGSGSGEVPSPAGYNRMYVHCEGTLTYDKWWEGVRAGRIVITNGPLIRPTVEGEMPGHVFQSDAGSEIELEVGLTLSTRDRISYLEVIKNGDLVEQLRLEDWAKRGGRLTPVVFQESGWLLLRAVAEAEGTYRYAMTAPYYVEIGDRARISKASAQFFVDWVEERMANVKLTDAKEREAVLKLHRQAKAYWQDLVERANAE